MQIETYLTFPGTAADAIAFYAKTFGTEVTNLQRFDEMPGMPPMDAETGARIGHARITVNDKTLMVSDSFEAHSGPHKGFHGFSLSAQCDSVDQANALFATLSEGGAVTMPMDKTFWAAAFGMCVDRFGVPWMVNCDTPA